MIASCPIIVRWLRKISRGPMIHCSCFLILTFYAPLSLAADPDDFSADTQSFGVRLFLVPDAKEFQEMWSRLETPMFTIFDKVGLNKEFGAALIYWGGTPDQSGNCNIRMSAAVTKGKEVLARGAEMPICAGHPPPPHGVLALGDYIVDLVATETPESLVVKIEVTDHNSGEVLRVSAPIEVVEQ